MKKKFYLFCFLFGLTAASGAPGTKTPPQVTVVKFKPPAKKGNGNKKSSKFTSKPPKVDLINYKPPVKKK